MFSANGLELTGILYCVYVNVKYKIVRHRHSPISNIMNLQDFSSAKAPMSPSGADAPTYSISDLAQEFGITTRTIRFYEDKGLLNPTRNGLTRIYDAKERVRLRLILRGKRLGFSLEETAGIIRMYDSEPGESGQLEYMLKRLAKLKKTLLQQKLDLEQTMGELDQLEDQCRQRLAGMQKQSRQ